jgi:conjugative transfer signal peptidase TraF
VLVAGAVFLVVLKNALPGHFIINFTPSIPRGLYWVSHGTTPQRGDLVAFSIPARVSELVYERGYVPRSIRLLVKPVAALGGDRVCIRDHQLMINGEAVGHVLDVDREGRPMPQYSACDALPAGTLFVATSHDNSFDSRNFGPIELLEVRGTLSTVLLF